MGEQITGIQRFAYELCKALINDGVEITILAPRRIRKEYKLNCRIIKVGFFPGLFWEHIELALFLLLHKNPLLINFGSPGPLFYKNRIVSIHDISFYVNPEWFSWSYSKYYKLITPVFTRLSKKIITVSEFSKNEIANKLNINREKIVVISNAVSKNLKVTTSEINNKKEKYILTVSSLDPRKNLIRLVDAYNISGIKNDVKLIIVGKGSSMFNIKITEDLLNNSIGYVSDEELATLYKNAALFVYPSLYEGFGIPPLEAMSLGCPVVLSDIPVFREIFGDAVHYVDPFNKDSISEGILHVLSDDSYRNNLIQRGHKKALQYDWKRSAEKLAGVINLLL